MLQKLIKDGIKTCSQRRLVQGRSFAEMLERALRRYRNRAIETAQLVEELIELARQLRDAQQRGDRRHQPPLA